MYLSNGNMTANCHDYKTLLLRMVEDADVQPGVVAVAAARYGYGDIVYDMMSRGATAFSLIAKIAAQYGHPSIVKRVIQFANGNVDYRYIASGYEAGGHHRLADELRRHHHSRYLYGPSESQLPY